MTTGQRATRAPRAFAAALACVALATAGVARAAAVPQLAQLPQRWQDDDGRELALGQLSGDRVILTMAYASCHRICPATINALAAMQKRLDARGETAAFVVVGYDPDNDDAAAWREYRRRHHLERANWHFLSGTRAHTEQLARALGFDFWKYDEHVMHGSRALVFDASGRLQVALGPETRDWASVL